MNAWLIECAPPLGDTLYFCNDGDWCSNPNHAHKFATAQEANAKRTTMQLGERFRVAEHEWPERDNRVVMHAGMVEKLCADNERLERQLRALARGVCGRTHDPTHLGEPCPYCRANDAESQIAEARAIFERFDRGELYDTDAFQALRALLGPKPESSEDTQ
jgi:hypothetical protein